MPTQLIRLIIFKSMKASKTEIWAAYQSNWLGIRHRAKNIHLKVTHRYASDRLIKQNNYNALPLKLFLHVPCLY